MVNEERGPTVEIPCSCKGHNINCVMCLGAGFRTKKACARCGGVGKQGGVRCLDCRGEGWRDVEEL